MNLLNKMISPEEITARMDRMDSYSAMGDYECTTCGNAIEMYLQVENGAIVKASAFSQGCGYCRACAATAAYLAEGKTPDEAAFEVGIDEVRAIVGAPAGENIDGPLFATAALKLAVRNWEKSLKAAA